MYEQSINLAKQNSRQICLNAVRLIQERQIPRYSQMDAALLAQRLQPTLEMELRYLATSDLEEWRTYLTGLVQDLAKRGVDYNYINEMGLLLTQATKDFFQASLPPLGDVDGEKAEKLVTKLERRLDRFDMVATSITLAVGVQEKTATRANLEPGTKPGQ